MLLRAAAVESLCQISGVESVAFFIGENPLTDSDGNENGYMMPDEIRFVITNPEALYGEDDIPSR